jgi:hypothetical protein
MPHAQACNLEGLGKVRRRRSSSESLMVTSSHFTHFELDDRPSSHFTLGKEQFSRFTHQNDVW